MTLIINNLSIRFDKLLALNEVSVEASEGRVTVLLGPNAAGKSTLLRACVGAIQPDSGNVCINNQPVHRMKARTLAGYVAYVPQRPSVSAAFSVREVIELGRFALPPQSERIDWVIESLELSNISHRPFQQLSVGQQQRVTLARALAQLGENGCLILDEPTSAMDLKHVRIALGLVREAAGKGATVLLAIHDLQLAAAVADDAWLMKEGEIISWGQADQILTEKNLNYVFEIDFDWVNGESGTRIPIPKSLLTR